MEKAGAVEERVSVSKADLLAELIVARRNGVNVEGALRTAELKSVLGWGLTDIRLWIADCMESDPPLVECVRVRKLSIDGKNQPVPAYRICDEIDENDLIEMIRKAREG